MKIASFVIALFALAACSNARDYPLPESFNQWEVDEKLVKAVHELPAEDRALFAKYAAGSAIGSIFGKRDVDSKKAKTIGQAIEIQREREKRR